MRSIYGTPSDMTVEDVERECYGPAWDASSCKGCGCGVRDGYEWCSACERENREGEVAA